MEKEQEKIIKPIIRGQIVKNEEGQAVFRPDVPWWKKKIDIKEVWFPYKNA